MPPAASSTLPATRPLRLTNDKLQFRLLLALVLLVSGSLLLSSIRNRCHAPADSPPDADGGDRAVRLGRRGWQAFGRFQSVAEVDDGGMAKQLLTPADCSPRMVDAREVNYSMPHKFNELLQSLHPPFAPPKLKRKHLYMCDPHDRERLNREWSYCLPITGRHDLPYCASPNRMDLLVPQTPQTLCYSSVLHLILVDVYAELKQHGAKPALLFGSLLGAVRNESLIPFTEDADIGYVYSASLRMKDVKKALWEKGYHLFRQGVLRVCVAPTHPLAGNLYDPRRDTQRRSCHVPYADLYKMQFADNRQEWQVEETRNKRRVFVNKFEPYTAVKVNDQEFDTLADPVDFLEQEYGIQWRSPKKRGSYRVIDRGDRDDVPEGPMPRLPDGFEFELDEGEFDSAVDYDMPEMDAGDGEDDETGDGESHDLGD